MAALKPQEALVLHYFKHKDLTNCRYCQAGKKLAEWVFETTNVDMENEYKKQDVI